MILYDATLAITITTDSVFIIWCKLGFVILREFENVFCFFALIPILHFQCLKTLRRPQQTDRLLQCLSACLIFFHPSPHKYSWTIKHACTHKHTTLSKITSRLGTVWKWSPSRFVIRDLCRFRDGSGGSFNIFSFNLHFISFLPGEIYCEEKI